MKSFIKDDDCLQLNDSSRDIANHIAGYIANKAQKSFENCCGSNFIRTNGKPSASSYTSILSRGGLKLATEDLNDAVAKSFAILDASSSLIRGSKIPSMEAGTAILENFVDVPSLACEKHEETFSKRVLRAVCNCFFNAQRKRSNETAADDHVRAFKKSKRSKDDS